MSIRVKIILVVLPLLVVALVIAGISSYFIATTGITRIAFEFLDYKVSELEKYTESQWNLLVENELTGRPEMVSATQAGIEVYARSIIRSETEVILAFGPEGEILMSTAEDFPVQPEERQRIMEMIRERRSELATVPLGGVDRVVMGFMFEPFEWYLLITEEYDTFYQDVDKITVQTAYILAGGTILSILFLFLFVRYLTKPLTRVAGAMRGIISSSDLSSRVEVEYNDEIGELSHTFNIMISELEKAYIKIKEYAFEAVLAQKKEAKIRNIFQKYVPQDLIDRFFEHPESMLVGDNRVLSVLFSDIRSFTTISESMAPDDLVNSLNRYFSVMVDIIMNRGGVIDKYIGDAIMAFFGAPVKHDDDALQSVMAGIEMAEAVEEFNAEQIKLGKPEFKIGIGINYGVVTVGNIGTEKKMDYTVIGDMVNLASRLEGLTKMYKQTLLIADTLYDEIKDDLPCRLLDTVAVKGKTKGVKIYTAKKELSPEEQKAWPIHQQAMELYYATRFKEAYKLFQAVGTILTDDTVSKEMIRRCVQYVKTPPPADWNGVEVMTSK
jgi:adenylate cyclase